MGAGGVSCSCFFVRVSLWCVFLVTDCCRKLVILADLARFAKTQFPVVLPTSCSNSFVCHPFFSPGVFCISSCLEDVGPTVPRTCDVVHVVLQQSHRLVGSP